MRMSTRHLHRPTPCIVARSESPKELPKQRMRHGQNDTLATVRGAGAHRQRRRHEGRAPTLRRTRLQRIVPARHAGRSEVLGAAVHGTQRRDREEPARAEPPLSAAYWRGRGQKRWPAYCKATVPVEAGDGDLKCPAPRRIPDWRGFRSSDDVVSARVMAGREPCGTGDDRRSAAEPNVSGWPGSRTCRGSPERFTWEYSAPSGGSGGSGRTIVGEHIGQGAVDRVALSQA